MTDEDWLGALDLATMWTFDDVGHFQYIAFIFWNWKFILRYEGRRFKNSVNTSRIEVPRMQHYWQRSTGSSTGSRPHTFAYSNSLLSQRKNLGQVPNWIGKPLEDCSQSRFVFWGQELVRNWLRRCYSSRVPELASQSHRHSIAWKSSRARASITVVMCNRIKAIRQTSFSL